MTRMVPFGSEVYKSMVGFDKLFNEISNNVLNNSSFPPHNIVKVDEESVVIELAVAGWRKSEVTLQVFEGKLTIKGNKEGEDFNKYLHKGIGYRNWIKEFRLADNSTIEEAKLEDGILQVLISFNIPEEDKPKQIKLT